MVGEIPEASPHNESNADLFVETVACCCKEVDVKLWLQFEQDRFSGISAHEPHSVSGMPSPKDPSYTTGLQVAAQNPIISLESLSLPSSLESGRLFSFFLATSELP